MQTGNPQQKKQPDFPALKQNYKTIELTQLWSWRNLVSTGASSAHMLQMPSWHF